MLQQQRIFLNFCVELLSMKTDWDYTSLADAYLKRPDYSIAAIEAMLSISGLTNNESICDVGAGVAHLTLMLLSRGYEVAAVEPNDAMRKNGISRTKKYKNVTWSEASGENTRKDSQSFDMVTFGSSFNVCERDKALKETYRILKPNGWFACMWNHRSLLDPIQQKIEGIIKEYVPDYGYGTRREDQTSIINASNLFKSVVHIDSSIIHEQSKEECVEAWRSHATLERQAGSLFPEVIDSIENFLKSADSDVIRIPYTTNIWIAQIK